MTDVQPHADDQPILQVRRLSVGYHGSAMLPPLRFEVRPGELWALVGHNGSGKSTLLRTLVGLLPKITGELVWRAGATLGYVPQRSDFDRNVPARVLDLVRGGVHTGWSFVSPTFARRQQQRIQRALEDTNTAELARAQYAELSEGQKQRVLLARALVADPEVVVLDEPTSAMDLEAELAVFDLLDALRAKRRLAVLVVSHHMALLQRRATHIVLVDKDTRTALAGPAHEVLRSPELVRRYDAFDGAARGAGS